MYTRQIELQYVFDNKRFHETIDFIHQYFNNNHGTAKFTSSSQQYSHRKDRIIYTNVNKPSWNDAVNNFGKAYLKKFGYQISVLIVVSDD